MSWWVSAFGAWVVGSLPLGMIAGRMINIGQGRDLGRHPAIPALHAG